MRRRSKSVFVGAEVAHYFQNQQFDDSDDNDENEVNREASNEVDDRISDEELDEENGARDVDEDLLLIQEVYLQVPSNDKMPFDKRLEEIDWNSISIKNAEQKLLKIVDRERKFRLLHEILDDAHKMSLKTKKIEKPKTPIAQFMSENKESIRKELEKSSNSNIFSVASTMYKNLSEKEKNYYIKKTNSYREDYHEEMRKYSLKKGCAVKPKKKEKKLTPLGIFHQHGSLTGSNLSKIESTKKYSELPPEKKIVWILRYLGVNKGELLSYDQFIKAKDSLNKDEMNAIDEYEGKPKKKVAYNIFVKEYFEKSSDKDLKRCASLWKNLSANEKKVYEKQADKNEYEKQMFDYLSKLSKERRDLEIHSNSKLNTKIYERLLKTYGNTNKHSSGMTTQDSSVVKKQKRDKQPTLDNNDVTSPKKNMSKIHSFFTKFSDADIDEKISNSSPKKKNKDANKPKSNLFAKFTDEDDSKENPNKKSENSSFFSKFTEDDEPTKKKESNKKKKVPDSEFPRPIKIEVETDSEENKPKKSLEDSFNDFNNAHNSTAISKTSANTKKRKESGSEVSPKKKIRQNSSSEIETTLAKKPPKTALKFFTQNVYKGPKASAKEAFENLSSKEKKKITTDLKKAQKDYLENFEKQISSMSSGELQQIARTHKNSISNSDSD